MMRRWISMLLASILCVTVCCACGQNETLTRRMILGSAEQEQLDQLQTPYVGMVLKSLGGQFYPLIKAGAEMEADRLGVELIVVAPEEEANAEEQAELIEIMANMALDVLIIAPCEEAAVQDSVQLAKDNGKHILAVDESSFSDLYEDYVGTDNKAAGRRQGAYAASVAQTNTAVILRGMTHSRNHDQRTNGLQESLRQYDIHILTCRNCESSQKKARETMNNLLQTGQEIGVICTTNDDMAIGARQALDDAKMDIPIVSFDGTPDAVQMVLDGKLSGLIAQDAYTIGVQAVDAAVALHDGEAPPSHTVPFRLITPQTAREWLDQLNNELYEWIF